MFNYRFSDSSSKHNEILKVLAVILMVIDHVGYVFFPGLEWLRWIGRLAFPIFAYQLAIGYRFTSNKKKYMIRIWLFALIAQIPYTLLFDTFTLNILFTLFLSLLLIDRIEKKEYSLIPLIILSSIFLPFDYNWYGLLTPIIFYIFYSKKQHSLLFQIVLTALYILLSGAILHQALALLGVLICLYFPLTKFKITVNKYFFYWFYPGHLVILFIVKILSY